MEIQENISLKPFNTFGIEVQARFFTRAKSIDELKAAIGFAKDKNLPLLFLGGGSNVLFTENYNGLVVLVQMKGITTQPAGENEVLVTAQAGENWHKFVQWCLSQNFGGLENLSLIPGNVGTCPMQNIGAYGVEIKDRFHHCKALNIETLEVEEFSLSDCKFGYRESFFKREGKGKYVILEVSFLLTTTNHELKTGYGAIQEDLQRLGISKPTIQEVSKAVVRIRETKLPNPKETGNAGSFFKNPVISKEKFEALKNLYPEIPSYPNGDFFKLPAGWLIEKAGWKGKQVGNVAVHSRQALVIINRTGEATGKEIFNFSAQIIASIKEKFGIELEREVNII